MSVSRSDIVQGDALHELKFLSKNSVHAIVTDPPYELGLMGKSWDSTGIAYNVDLWRQCLRVLKPGGHLLSFGGPRTSHRMACAVEDAGFEIRDSIYWVYGSGFPKSMDIGKKLEQWKGWGTTLKPAHEPIILARKPLAEKTIIKNVLEWETGGINIDECRVPIKTEGRFPANLIHDGSDEVLREFAKAGTSTSMKESRTKTTGTEFGLMNDDSWEPSGCVIKGYGDEGTPARFFYQAKASKKDRGQGNNHPTVKPVKLMEYLVKLITPPGGTVLDPFAGSGTTLLAAQNLGFNSIGIEINPEYIAIINSRLGKGEM